MAGMDRGTRTMEEMFGLSAALTTPFSEDLSVDVARLVTHSKHLLEEGCRSVTLFGTTGEGASLAENERAAILDAFARGNFDPARLVVGISATAMEQAEVQARAALDSGVDTLLVPPPFYFKEASETGVFTWYARLLDRIAPLGPSVILYHIPQLTAVPLALGVARRLKRDYGPAILGVKDSGGHWPTTEAFLRERDLQILVGDERHLAEAMRLGGAGAISGMANVFPRALAKLVHTGEDNVALSRMVDCLVKMPVTPAVKTLVGLKYRESGWNRVRAPLEPTPAAETESLKEMMDRFKQMQAT